MFPGGISDKLGNRYEAKWLVRQLLDVIAGKAEWLRFEGVVSQFDGFEFAIHKGGVTEWHQTKMNAPNGNWTLNALEREGVLTAFRNRLVASEDDRCLFVSQDPAKDLRTFIDKAEIANDYKELVEALSRDQKDDKFHQLLKGWSVEEATAYAWLRRCECLTLPESELESIIASFGDLYFMRGGSSVFPVLRDYLEERFNKILTTEAVRAEIRDGGKLLIKDWSLDPTLRERLYSETDAYLQTYSPFGAGGSVIPRRQTRELIDLILKPNGPNVLLLTGIAGSGKSGVIRGLIDEFRIGEFRDLGILHLAFRVDHHLGHSTPQEIGLAITGREESPVSTLKGLEPERHSVLIIDQVDAVSEVSGRNGAVKEAVLRMVEHVRNFDTVRLVLVCRSFDLENDPRLKALKELKRVEQIEVPLLEWDGEVAPFLSNKGIDISLLSTTQKDLLRLPLNLAVFLEVSSEGQSFVSRNDLFEKLIQKKDRTVRRDRSLGWTITEPLTVLAKWMSDRQRLEAPYVVLDDFSGALDILASEGFIISSRNRINFFHESFFDYLYARAFLADDQSVIDLLTSTEQHLFRRTQTRQILETLRQNDLGRYFHELQAVLTADGIRYHVKTAVAQWIGSLQNPTETERDIVFRLDDSDGPFRPLVRYALLSSVGWFDLLYKDGWILRVLNGKSDERRQSIFWWLSNIAGERPTEVAAILDSWWGNDPVRGKRLLEWFVYIRRQKPDQALLALCKKVIRSKPLGLFENNTQYRSGMLLALRAEKNAEEGSGILQALFDAWFEMHPGRYPFERDEVCGLDMHSLRWIAEKSPRGFITATIDVVMRTIDIINHHEGEDCFRYRIFSGYRFGSDEFLGLIESTMKHLANEDPDTTKKFLSKLDASKHEAILHLHLEVVSANGKAFASHFLSLLGNKNLFEAGWYGSEWKSFADAARAVYPYLSNDDRHRVEEVIFSHQPEIDLAIKVAHQIKEHGETEPWWNRHGVISDLNRSGFGQWCILESIGEDLLTDTGVQRLKELRRKFPGAKVPKPIHIEFHAVGSPIKREKTTRMSDADWLSAIVKYDNDEWRRYGHDFIDGGASQLAGELKHAAKENPARFVTFMKQIPIEANQVYIEQILWGLTEVDVEDELLKEAVIDAHNRPGRPYGDEIARLFEKHPQIAKDPALFDILTWYVENGEANEDEAINLSNIEREVFSIDDLVGRGERVRVRGINGVRGRAAEAMGAVLWQVPDIVERAWEILERRIQCEPLISVRCSLMWPLVPLFNHDRLRCASLVERLICKQKGKHVFVSPETNYQRIDLFRYLQRWIFDMGRRLLDQSLNQFKRLMKRQSKNSGGQEYKKLHLSPLITHQGIYLLPFLLHWVPDIGRRLLDRLLNSGDETMRMIGAWHVFRRSFQDPTYVSDADCLIEEGNLYRRLAADVASHAIVYEEYRERAALQLVRFFNDEDEHVRRQAGNVFHEIQPEEFLRFKDIAMAYLDSQAFEHETFAFFHALEKATCSVHELVICAAEKIISDYEANNKVEYRHVDFLEDLLKREYASSESNPDLRKRLLDVIDKMLEKELYGTDKILKAHERG